MEKMIPTTTVGEILQEEFLGPMGISAYKSCAGNSCAGIKDSGYSA